MSPRLPTVEELGRWARMCEDRATHLRSTAELRSPAGENDAEDAADAAEAWDDLAGFLRDLI